MKEHPTETEATLVIISPRPQATANSIGGLRVLGDYKLVPEPDIEIRDRYYDTDEGDLWSQLIALRIRETPSGTFVAVKGPQTKVPDQPGITRFEIEGLWSDAAIARIGEALAARGLEIGRRITKGHGNHPGSFVERLGLTMIQDRRTRRAPRDVFHSSPSNTEDQRLAELAIDMTEYLFGAGRVRHFEVEIEAKQRNGFRAVGQLADLLSETYQQQLEQWPHSKLATGRAIEALFNASGDLIGVSGQRSLSREVYESIDKFLNL